MEDRWPRIQFIMLEAERLNLEGKYCTDPARIRAIGDELQVLYDSALEIRREQILESMPQPKAPRRRWWRRTAR